VRADGGYSSASDLDEEAYAFLAANNVGEGEVSHQDEEHIGAEAAEHYEGLVVQRVLSAQMEKAEQNQRHTLSDPGLQDCVHNVVHTGIGDRTCPIPYPCCTLLACEVGLADTEGSYSSCT
jgi:hypothetical protein